MCAARQYTAHMDVEQYIAYITLHYIACAQTGSTQQVHRQAVHSLPPTSLLQAQISTLCTAHAIKAAQLMRRQAVHSMCSDRQYMACHPPHRSQHKPALRLPLLPPCVAPTWLHHLLSINHWLLLAAAAQAAGTHAALLPGGAGCTQAAAGGTCREQQQQQWQ